ncbi:alpha/beta hydrolase [Phycicoccus sp. CSK15P-2]|uniref:alpha/beta hydrolase family protein n=1 Tax=Phycicoccus sp. CSK15P-2 TaxID=2807627 RepID=UPI0019523A4F|nr:alpha/beta hydrolase [Phycicoccus sp. CSK15P-2]MBM6404563.1 alpha/beta hydrolase [Phycicoccus sp. CSK15P-2]
MSEDPDLLRRTARGPDRTEFTGPEQTDVYDVWEPEPHRARGVTVALVHGGFWREQYDRAHLAPLAEALARDGFHVASLEYPRIGMPGGGWPGTGRALLARLGAAHDDTDLPDLVVVVGHSAGGHLALWLASGGRAPWLLGVVALAPAADLGEVDRLHLSNDAARALLGGGPDEAPDAWADADPARQRLTTSAVVVTGEVDDVVPASVVDAYVRSRGRDEPLHTAVARGADHFDVVDPESPAYLLLLAEVEELTLHP